MPVGDWCASWLRAVDESGYSFDLWGSRLAKGVPATPITKQNGGSHRASLYLSMVVIRAAAGYRPPTGMKWLLHFQDVKWFHRTGLARSWNFFLQVKNWMEWMDLVILVFGCHLVVVYRLKRLPARGNFDYLSPVQATWGVGVTSGCRSKVVRAQQHWDRSKAWSLIANVRRKIFGSRTPLSSQCW